MLNNQVTITIPFGNTLITLKGQGSLGADGVVVSLDSFDLGLSTKEVVNAGPIRIVNPSKINGEPRTEVGSAEPTWDPNDGGFGIEERDLDEVRMRRDGTAGEYGGRTASFGAPPR